MPLTSALVDCKQPGAAALTMPLLLPQLQRQCGNECPPAPPPPTGAPDEEWEEFLNQGWDRAKAAEIAAGLPDLVLQVGRRKWEAGRWGTTLG